MSIEINKYSDLLFNSNFNFEEIAIEAFNYQYNNNKIYNQYCNYLSIRPNEINSIYKIPFLPISFFKTHKVLTTENFDKTFFSSSTTGSIPSKHFVSDINLYEKSFIHNFEHFYGNVNNYVILALLPSYLERGGSSLVYMLDKLIKMSGKKESNFFLNNYSELFSIIKNLEEDNQKYILFGVSYALIDFSEICSIPLKNAIVIETGGMKGRRQEMSKIEFYDLLKTKLQVKSIHSEYGMTELLSQAYSHSDNRFFCPAQMKVLIRNINDPFEITPHGKGALNIIDLANINSCSFIASDDYANVFLDNSFELLGRINNSDIRGCNLLID